MVYVLMCDVWITLNFLYTFIYIYIYTTIVGVLDQYNSYNFVRKLNRIQVGPIVIRITY